MCSGSTTTLLQFTRIFATLLQLASTNHAGMAMRMNLNVKFQSRGPLEGFDEKQTLCAGARPCSSQQYQKNATKLNLITPQDL